jgi:DNA helicase-2/ATP-dependent DNA helicase PcrA
MPVVPQITKEDIEYAERILLPFGRHFDAERIDFIKNFYTLDLQAVPGSGKTTALLAKLLIIERHLPFNSEFGVLVVSHTNAAVDEIKDKIERYCPKLFSYPNFVGTIQNFVDEFLAIPYYNHTFRDKPLRIDNDTYLSQFKKQCQAGAWYCLSARYQRLNDLLLKISALESRDYIFDNLSDNEINITRISKTTDTYQNLRDTKLRLLREGYLNFNDAYCLAMQYLKSTPRIQDIIRKRFDFVFVDEMQDMDVHQYDLLERLFAGDDGLAIQCYQRIGDKNQAIYNDNTAHDNIWNDRETVLKLKGSHRLSPLIAKVVQSFALYPIQVRGLRTNIDGSAIAIKPRIIVYDDATKTNVIGAYISIIKGLKEDGSLSSSDSVYYAVAWNTTWSDEESANSTDKIRLIDYYPSYIKRSKKPQKDYQTLEDYIISAKGTFEMKTTHDAILCLILKVLQLEDIKNEKGRSYSKTELFKYLAANSRIDYDVVKGNIYLWCIKISRDEYTDVITQVRAYLPQILSLLNASITTKSSSFVNGKASNRSGMTSDNNPALPINIASIDGIDINLATVHSIKGQTHTATLYLDTYYQADGTGTNAKSYESQRLAGQFKDEEFSRQVGVRVKQSAKMVYVGLSRPTHLVCFAVHKDRFHNSNYSKKWMIKDITEGGY